MPKPRPIPSHTTQTCSASPRLISSSTSKAERSTIADNQTPDPAKQTQTGDLHKPQGNGQRLIIPHRDTLKWMLLISLVLHLSISLVWMLLPKSKPVIKSRQVREIQVIRIPIKPPPHTHLARQIAPPTSPKQPPISPPRPKPKQPPRSLSSISPSAKRKPKSALRSHRSRLRSSARKKDRAALPQRSKLQPTHPTPPHQVARKPSPSPAARSHPSYRQLDLRPRTGSPNELSPNSQAKGHAPKSGTGNDLRAWKGDSHFARNMRQYHSDWWETHLRSSGLIDVFFGKAQIALDRCIEHWFVYNLPKHLSYRQLAFGGSSKWSGQFEMQWDFRGKPTIKLNSSRGFRKLDNIAYNTAKRCAQKIAIPKRLKGKHVWMLVQAAVYSKIRADLFNLFGLSEERNLENGAIHWTIRAPGSIQIWANTMISRSRIK